MALGEIDSTVWRRGDKILTIFEQPESSGHERGALQLPADRTSVE
jgi:hypothetical protein